MARVILFAWALRVCMARCNATDDNQCLLQAAVGVETADSTGLLQGRVEVDQVKPLNFYGVDSKEKVVTDRTLKEAGFATQQATSWLPPNLTLKSAGNRIYHLRSMRFIPVLVLILCYLVSHYGHRDKQEKGGDLFVLMEAHDLHKIPSFWEDPIGKQDFTKERLQKALPRVAVAVVLWLAGLYFNNVCQAWLQQHMSKYYDAATLGGVQKDYVLLWDMGYKFLPGFSSHWTMEFFAQGAPILCTFRFCVFPGPLSMRWTVLARMFLLWGLLWTLRAVTIVATVLPNPDAECKPHTSYPDNVFMEAAVLMPPFNNIFSQVTCQDVLFSGHTVILTLASIMWLHYSHWAPWPEWSNASSWAILAFRCMVILNMLVGYYCIIASKFHYSADVLMGCLLTIFIFQSYHSSTWFLPSRRVQAFQKFFEWFEEDAVDVAVPSVVRERKLAASAEVEEYSGY